MLRLFRRKYRSLIRFSHHLRIKVSCKMGKNCFFNHVLIPRSASVVLTNIAKTTASLRNLFDYIKAEIVFRPSVFRFSFGGSFSGFRESLQGCAGFIAAAFSSPIQLQEVSPVSESLSRAAQGSSQPHLVLRLRFLFPFRVKYGRGGHAALCPPTGPCPPTGGKILTQAVS